MEEKIIYLKTKDGEVIALYNDNSQKCIRKGNYGISYMVIGVSCWENLVERYKKVNQQISKEEFWNEVDNISNELTEFQEKFVDWTESETLNEEQREVLRYKNIGTVIVDKNTPF